MSIDKNTDNMLNINKNLKWNYLFYNKFILFYYILIIINKDVLY